MTAASTLTGAELVPVVQGGANRRTTTADIAALGSVVNIGAFSAQAVGNNWRPAVQAAITYAVANGITKVVRGSAPVAMELWERVGTGTLATLSAFWAEKLLTVPACSAISLDFEGAIFTKKSPTGAAPYHSQPIADLGFGPWFAGGFLTLTGTIGRFELHNVSVGGGYTGTILNNGDANLYDKGFSSQDLAIGTIIMSNVRLTGFGGEICYDNCSDLHLSSNCHFSNSGQSAWNPGGSKVRAWNLEAGDAYAPLEVTGSTGHVYFGGRFFNGATGALLGGPDPDYLSGYHFAWPVRRTDAQPPWIEMHNTRFESITGGVLINNWVRGKVVLTDTGFVITGDKPTDIDLDIEGWIDRANNIPLVSLNGPADLTTQISGTPGGTFYEKPKNMSIRVQANRTALAVANGRNWDPVVLLNNGLFDHATIDFKISGAGDAAWAINGTPVAGYAVPLMQVDPRFVASLPGGLGVSDFPTSADLTLEYTLNNSGVFIFPSTTATTWSVTILLPYIYRQGQKFRLMTSTNDATRIVGVAKNATGVRLNADRTMRRNGEFLEMSYDSPAALLCEADYLDQGV